MVQFKDVDVSIIFPHELPFCRLTSPQASLVTASNNPTSIHRYHTCRCQRRFLGSATGTGGTGTWRWMKTCNLGGFQTALTSQKRQGSNCPAVFLRQALYRETLASTVRVSTRLVPLPFLGVVVATSATNSLYSGLAKSIQNFQPCKICKVINSKLQMIQMMIYWFIPRFLGGFPKFQTTILGVKTSSKSKNIMGQAGRPAEWQFYHCWGWIGGGSILVTCLCIYIYMNIYTYIHIYII